MSTWSEEEECEAGERGPQLGGFGLTHSLIPQHTCTHTCAHMSTHTRGNVLFFCSRPIALDQIRDARSQGTNVLEYEPA